MGGGFSARFCFIDVPADGVIEQPAVQSHQQLEFPRGRLAAGPRTAKASRFPNQSWVQALAHHPKEAAGNRPIREPGEKQDADELASLDRLRKLHVEADQLVLEVEFAVVQERLPLRIPAPQKDVFIHALQQRLLGGEVVVDESVSNADCSGKLAHLRVQAVLGKELDGAVQDVPLSVSNGHSPAGGSRRSLLLRSALRVPQNTFAIYQFVNHRYHC
jgi:hypothetical protein